MRRETRALLKGFILASGLWLLVWCAYHGCESRYVDPSEWDYGAVRMYWLTRSGMWTITLRDPETNATIASFNTVESEDQVEAFRKIITRMPLRRGGVLPRSPAPVVAVGDIEYASMAPVPIRIRRLEDGAALLEFNENVPAGAMHIANGKSRELAQWLDKLVAAPNRRIEPGAAGDSEGREE